jgi:hypothetical protein
MNNVVGLRGVAPRLPGVVDQKLVDHLQSLLEKATNAEIDGISYAVSFTDGASGSGCCGRSTWALVGNLECAKKLTIDDLLAI